MHLQITFLGMFKIPAKPEVHLLYTHTDTTETSAVRHIRILRCARQAVIDASPTPVSSEEESQEN